MVEYKYSIKKKLKHLLLEKNNDKKITGPIKKEKLTSKLGVKQIVPLTSEHKKNCFDCVKIAEVAKEGEALEVRTQHLFGFSKIHLAELLKPKAELKYHAAASQIIPLDQESIFQILKFFFEYRNILINFKKKDTGEERKECADFGEFIKDKLDLFEEFFPLPKKHRLFVEKLAEIICKNKNTNHCKHTFFDEYKLLCCILEKIKHSQYDIFVINGAFLDLLEDTDIQYQVTKSRSYDLKYEFFKKQCNQAIIDINQQDIVDDLKEIKNRIKILAESTFTDPVFGEKSFSERMKEGVFCSGFVKGSEMRKIKDFWLKIREQIIKENNSLDVRNLSQNNPIHVLNISVNDNVVSERHVLGVVEFLGSIPQERGQILLGEWRSSQMPNNQSILRDLVVVALSNITCHNQNIVRNPWERKTNLDQLLYAFNQLTKKERMALLRTNVNSDGMSLPLMFLILIDPSQKDVMLFIIENFGLEAFDIKFRFNEEREECDIIQLLEKMKNFCEETAADQKTTQKERSFFSEYIENDRLRYLIDELKEIKNKLQPNLFKDDAEPKTLKESSSTQNYLCQKNKEKFLERCVEKENEKKPTSKDIPSTSITTAQTQQDKDIASIVSCVCMK